MGFTRKGRVALLGAMNGSMALLSSSKCIAMEDPFVLRIALSVF